MLYYNKYIALKENTTYTTIKNFSEPDIEIVNEVGNLIGLKLLLFFYRYSTIYEP